MIGLILLALVVIGWVVILPVLALVLHSRLSTRLGALERTVQELRQRLAEAAAGQGSDASTEVRTQDTRPAVAAERIPSVDKVGDVQADRQPNPWKPFYKPDNEPAPTVAAAPTAHSEPEPVPRINHAAQFMAWLQENWVLAAGAVSLALAGIFLVQYGAERGLLTPSARVLAALCFGAVLIVAGEVLRRRFGDEAEGPTRHLPSALAGAGIFTLFSAVLAARALFGLIDPTVAFLGLALVSVIGVVLGWFYGALLSGVGILGALLAPYLVGGDTDTPWVLSYYFALIAVVGLAIDSLKRWAWLSVLALGGSALSIWLIYLAAGFAGHFLATTAIVMLAALTLPERRLVPRLDGPPVSALFFGRTDQRFPVWLAFAALANAALGAGAVGSFESVVEAYLALTCLAALMGAALFWLRRAPALVDLVALPGLAGIGVIAVQAVLPGDLFLAFYAPPGPEQAPSGVAWHLAGFGVVGSILAAIRLRDSLGPIRAIAMSLVAAVFAPTIVFVLEFLWSPAEIYGPGGWAAVVLAVAAGMTLLCERVARLESLAEPKLHAALFAGSAISLIGLALFILLTKTALTLALAVMVLAVVAIDRRFDLPIVRAFIQMGLLIIGYRIVVDPGVPYMTSSASGLPEILLVHLGSAALLVAAMVLHRTILSHVRAGLEGTLSIIAAALVYILAERYLIVPGQQSHASVGLMAALWLVISLAQLRSADGADPVSRAIRLGISGSIGAFALLAILSLMVDANPLLTPSERVAGIPVFSSLALAYLPLAGVLVWAALRLRSLPETVLRPIRIGVGALSGLFVCAYVGLTIRHVWRGPDLSVPGVSDPELYTYTVAMLVAAAGALFVAFLRRNLLLRRAALALVGLTIAKVFLVDMAGLTGLMRVLSFMGLGLSLLALTWLNRVMDAQWERGDGAEAQG